MNTGLTACLQHDTVLDGLLVLQEVMINVGDVGKDYEHGVQLIKKLNEFRGTGEGVRNNNMCQRHQFNF